MYKIVTLCGSMKFQSQMMALAQKLEVENKYIVIQCVYSDSSIKLSPQDITTVSELHYKKIAMSDAIYVVNVDGYIGESTRQEIIYAESLDKEVLYLEPINKF